MSVSGGGGGGGRDNRVVAQVIPQPDGSAIVIYTDGTRETFGQAQLASAGSAATAPPSFDDGGDTPNGQSDTDPYTGFASQYQPGSLQNVIYDSPWAILPDVFGRDGSFTATPGYQNLRDLGFDPLTLFNISQGAYNNMQNYNAGDYANWLAQMYGGYGTVGGRAFNSRELLGSIAGARDGSALRLAMDAGDTGTQVRTLYNLGSEAYNAGMNPLAARAMQSGLAQAGDQYLNAALKSNANEGANAQTFDKWLLQNMPYLLGR